MILVWFGLGIFLACAYLLVIVLKILGIGDSLSDLSWWVVLLPIWGLLLAGFLFILGVFGFLFLLEMVAK